MLNQAIGLLDVGFIRSVAAETLGIPRPQVRLDARALHALTEQIANEYGAPLLRTYWYDGQYAPEDRRYTAQRKYLDAVARVPGISMRLGQLVERTPAWHAELRTALERAGVSLGHVAQHLNMAPELVQKGVDTLMVLDLVLLAQRRAYSTAILFAGDRDLTAAVRLAQDEGRRVVLVCPAQRCVTAELRNLADAVVEVEESQIAATTLNTRPTHLTGRHTADQGRGDASAVAEEATASPPAPTPPPGSVELQGRARDEASSAEVAGPVVSVHPGQGVLFSVDVAAAK